MRDVETKVSLVANVQAGFALGGVNKSKPTSIALQVLFQELSQAAARDDKTSPMLGKAKAVGTLDLVAREKRLKTAGIIVALKTCVPNMDLAWPEREERIDGGIHEAD